MSQAVRSNPDRETPKEGRTRWTLTVLLAIGIACQMGCVVSPWKSAPVTSTATAAGIAAGTVRTPQGTGLINASQPLGPEPSALTLAQQAGAVTNPSRVSQPDTRAIDQLVAIIAARDALDAAGRARLAQDLQQTDPSLWPALMQAFEAALAYQRQLKDKSAAAGATATTAVSESRSTAKSTEPFGKSVEASRNLPDQLKEASEPQRKAAESTGADELPSERTVQVEPRTAATMILPPPGLSASPSQTPAALPSHAKTESAVVAVSALDQADRSLRATAQREASALPRGVCGEKTESSRSTGERETASGVVPASYHSPSAAFADPWLERLDAAIKALESEVRLSPQTSAELARQARLRLLYLASGRREDALRPIPAASPSMQDSWAQMIYGLSAWMDVERVPDASRRAAEARQQLLSAANRLGELAPLSVRNASFAKEVKSFGDITPFDKTEFGPGQEVLLYAELENFKSEETPKGFHTQFRGSYEIFDSRGQRVTAQELGKTEEYCRNHRRDFFVVYNFRLPKRIYSGRHILQLTVEDLHGQKIGQTSLEFTVKAGSE